MKKNVFFSVVVLAIMMLVCSCSTTDLTTNQVGWSNYSDIVVKDYDVVGIVTVESTETIKVGFLSLTKEVTGSRVTYADLMKKAAEMGADDVINVRIDKKNNFKTTPFDFLIGSTKTYTYVATGTAIKYKDAQPKTYASDSEGVEVKTVSPSGSPLDSILNLF